MVFCSYILHPSGCGSQVLSLCGGDGVLVSWTQRKGWGPLPLGCLCCRRWDVTWSGEDLCGSFGKAFLCCPKAPGTLSKPDFHKPLPLSTPIVLVLIASRWWTVLPPRPLICWLTLESGIRQEERINYSPYILYPQSHLILLTPETGIISPQFLIGRMRLGSEKWVDQPEDTQLLRDKTGAPASPD